MEISLEMRKIEEGARGRSQRKKPEEGAPLIS
jgi:hypothetical protein